MPTRHGPIDERLAQRGHGRLTRPSGARCTWPPGPCACRTPARSSRRGARSRSPAARTGACPAGPTVSGCLHGLPPLRRRARRVQDGQQAPPAELLDEDGGVAAPPSRGRRRTSRTRGRTIASSGGAAVGRLPDERADRVQRVQRAVLGRDDDRLALVDAPGRARVLLRVAVTRTLDRLPDARPPDGSRARSTAPARRARRPRPARAPPAPAPPRRTARSGSSAASAARGVTRRGGVTARRGGGSGWPPPGPRCSRRRAPARPRTASRGSAAPSGAEPHDGDLVAQQRGVRRQARERRLAAARRAREDPGAAGRGARLAACTSRAPASSSASE